MNNLAINLKMLREKKKMTQTAVSNELHLGERVLSHYENGKREPDNELLIAFADYFGVSVDYLLRENEETKAYRNQLENLLATYVRKQLPDVIEKSELWKKYQENCKQKEKEWLEHQDDEEWIWTHCEEEQIENIIAMQEADEKACGGNFWDACQDYEKLLLSGNASALRPLLAMMNQIDEIENTNEYSNDLECWENEMEAIEKIMTYCAIARKSISDELQSIYDCIQ